MLAPAPRHPGGGFRWRALKRDAGDADNRRMHPTFLSETAVNGQIRHLLGIVIDIGTQGPGGARLALSSAVGLHE